MNVTGSPGVIFQRFMEFEDAARKRVLRDESIGPDSIKEILLLYNRAGMLRQVQQGLHDLRFEVHHLAVGRNPVQNRFDEPVSDVERRLHARPNLGWHYIRTVLPNGADIIRKPSAKD